MLRSLNEISGYRLGATDDEIGKCKDFLLDDRQWVVRYMVADTHAWLPGGRKVLISPIALGTPDWENHILPVMLTRQNIEDSPSIDEHSPVSREYEQEYFKHYGYGYYWMGTEIWGAYEFPRPLFDEKAHEEMLNFKPKEDHLRSAKEMEGYAIQALDHSIGHIVDFILDDQHWAIAYFVVDTNNWLPGGRKVLVPSTWLDKVSWEEQTAHVNLTAQQIKDSPHYNPEAFIKP